VRLAYLGITLAVAVTAACPRNDLLSLGGPGGFAIGGGGGGGTGSDVLLFTVQPSTATAGNIITPAIQVTVHDSLGNPDAAFTANITVSIGLNPVGGRLSGTLSVAPVNAVAQFGDLSIDQSGSGYTLRATAPGATSAASASFTILTP